MDSSIDSSSSNESGSEDDGVAWLVLTTSLPPPPSPPSSSTHLCHMAKGYQKVTRDHGSDSDSGSDDEFTSSSYDELASLIKKYKKIIKKSHAKIDKVKYKSLLDKCASHEESSVGLRYYKKRL